jgi:hypothetical protein
MSVQARSTKARHSDLVPSMHERQPEGTGVRPGQSEYCSSSLTRTRQRPSGPSAAALMPETPLHKPSCNPTTSLQHYVSRD